VRAGWRFVVAAMSSSRSYTILTGRPAFFATVAQCAASIDGYSSLPPKPPPVTDCVMTTPSASQPRKCFIALCT
jgi:hypothetical protein